MDLNKYKAIRPLSPEEVPSAIQELLANPMLRATYEQLGMPLSWEDLAQLLSECKSVEEFKLRFSYHLVKHVAKLSCREVSLTPPVHLSPNQAYTYISNHRDIILDSAFLNVWLYDAGLRFPQIAIGDNLMIFPWVTTLVKLNGSFLVRRGLQGRDVLLAAKELSEYMYDSLADGNSLWIAQREGRSKDSTDHTQPALLKMLAMGGKSRDPREALRQLHIVPTTCSYEFDPCDYLKAREMLLKRELGSEYRKTPEEDGLNMKTGVMGYKGRVNLHCGRPLNELMDNFDWSSVGEKDYIETIASLMDDEIHRNYILYPINYIALDRLEGTNRFADKYTPEELQQVEEYLAQRQLLIELPEGIGRDEAFLLHCLLTMYANPLRSFLRTQQ